MSAREEVVSSSPVGHATLAATDVGTQADICGATSPMLRVRNLNAAYGRAQVLYDISLEVRRGEVVALMGRNGAGKSTTMKALMGMLPTRTGDITFRGQSINDWAPYRIARLGMGFVPEDRRVFGDLSVLDNLDMGRQPRRADAPYWTPEKLFALFPNLGEMPHRPGSRMSGGEQQMLTVSRTLMGNPYLVLLDEPSEGVAPVIVEQMANMILELKREGLSILLSEQNMHFAELVSDRAYVLEKGQVRFSGSIDALAQDEAVQRAYLSV
ncbi:branched-chain amino acid transport system ATP-binding protein [Robbsia andropogonis]